MARRGEHLTRVMPVEDTAGASVSEVEKLAGRVLPQHFPEQGESFTFAVRPETHSPRVKDSSPGDLVRRVADVVPRNHKVDLSTKQQKTVLLMLVGVRICCGA